MKICIGWAGRIGILSMHAPLLKESVMAPSDRHLLKNIGIALMIKMLVLFGIWSIWIKGNHVAVNADSASTHLLSQPQH